MSMHLKYLNQSATGLCWGPPLGVPVVPMQTCCSCLIHPIQWLAVIKSWVEYYSDDKGPYRFPTPFYSDRIPKKIDIFDSDNLWKLFPFSDSWKPTGKKIHESSLGVHCFFSDGSLYRHLWNRLKWSIAATVRYLYILALNIPTICRNNTLVLHIKHPVIRFIFSH